MISDTEDANPDAIMVGLSLGLSEGIALLSAEGLSEGFSRGPGLGCGEAESLGTKARCWLGPPLGP